jgi:ABC-type branched-subunit amino acid transport system ATPase component/branched-subunit amino acid ABC-type transport system permease component
VSTFLTLLLTGLVSGALYSMISTGVVLGYATSGIFNFGHGAVAFAAAIAFFQLREAAHLPSLAAAAICVLVLGPLLGLALDVLVFRKLAAAPEQARILGTVGIAIALPSLVVFATQELVNLLRVSLADTSVGFAASVGPQPPTRWHVTSGAVITSDQVVIFACAGLAALGLWWLVRRSRVGLEMRATVDRRELAALRGIDIARASRVAWMASSMMACLVGVAGGVVVGLLSNSYTLLLFAAAAAAVFGRLRSVPLAFIGGLFLGVAQNMVAGYLSIGFLQNVQGLNSSVPFLILLIGLAVQGSGRTRQAGTLATGRAGSAMVALPVSGFTWRRLLPWLVFAVVVVITIELLASDYWTGLIVQGLVFAMIYLSFVVVTGVGGMVSLAQSAFVSAAGLVTGFLWGTTSLSLLLCVLIAVLASMVIGVVVALPALRLGGLALALATLALAFLCDQVLFPLNSLSNQNQGWQIPRVIAGLNLTSNRAFGLFSLALLLAVTVMVRNFERSPSGRAIVAVRSSQVGAASSGISLFKAKLTVFAFSAGIAGLAGVLLSMFLQQVTPGSYPAITGLLWVAVAATFGLRRPAGAYVAGMTTALFPVLLSYVTTSAQIPSILFGLGAIGLAQNPDGALPQMQRQFAGLMRRARGRHNLPTVRVASAAALVAAAPGPEGVDPQPGLVPVPEDVALRFEGVCAGYGELRVVDEVDLMVRKGRITTLLGANGAGKSTLCKVAGGLVQPTRGRVLVGDQPFDHANAKRIFVAPEMRGVFAGLTVEENLGIWLPDRASRELAFERFPLLARRRKTQAGSLSGGEQQLLTLAPAFVRQPDVLVADEPSLGLAPRVIDEIMLLFRELRDHGVAILLVEEKPRDLLTIADEVVVLALGRVVWRGIASELDEARVTDIYLGHSHPQDRPATEVPADRARELLPTPDSEMGLL